MTLVFADPKHLHVLETTGKYPKIHDAVFNAATSLTPLKNALVIEFGACLGLISHRLISHGGAAASIAIEANKSYIDRGLRHPALEFVNVEVRSMADLAPITPMVRRLGKGRPKVAMARRVLSEVWTSGQQVAIDAVAQWLHQNDVSHLVIEGRAPVPKPTHPIHSGEIEVEKVESSGLFKTAHHVGTVFILEAM